MILKPLEFFYQFLSSVKNQLYEKNILKSFELPVPVVSVGNLSFGGTGKTPFIEFLINNFFQDKKVVVVCRSYSGNQLEPEKVNLNRQNFFQYYGDEASLLQSKHPHVHVWSGPQKYKSAQAGLADQPDVILIDDGFSHRKLKRRFDIVLIDATKFLKDYQRESFTSLDRAQAIILTKINLVTQQELEKHIQFLNQHHIIQSDRLFLAEIETQLEVSNQHPLMVFCGIGNPESFKLSLQKMGYQIVVFKVFKDHVPYSAELQNEIYFDYLEHKKNHPYLQVVTTAKDFIKINKMELKNLVHVSDVKIKMNHNEQQRLFEKIRSAL